MVPCFQTALKRKALHSRDTRVVTAHTGIIREESPTGSSKLTLGTCEGEIRKEVKEKLFF